jgi:hypothetical protein
MTSATYVPRQRQTAELDLLRLYLDEIGRHPLLTAQDEVRLSQAYQAGLDARRRLGDCDPDDPPARGCRRLWTGASRPTAP